MLRALKPFFELIIFTYKNKEEAEAIVNEIEKDQNFFTYIIPVNYCTYVASEGVYIKDLSILFGNRLDGEVALVTTKAYDGILQPLNSIPIEPFMGDDQDCLLLFLEVYLMSMRWSKDIRQKVHNDFNSIYKNIDLLEICTNNSNSRQNIQNNNNGQQVLQQQYQAMPG